MDVAVMATLTTIPKGVGVCRVKRHRGLPNWSLVMARVWFNFFEVDKVFKHSAKLWER